MTAALHRDMVNGVAQRLTSPMRQHAGYPVDFSTLTLDTYFVGGITDHISPWQATYRSARLFGNTDLRFVLSSSGHIAALVNPPGSRKASYRAGAVDEPDPAAW